MPASTVNGDSSHHTANGESPSDLGFSSIPDCLEDYRAGRFLIVLDSPSRENEGDLIISAPHLTTAKASFMIRHTSGYICCAMPSSRALALDLPPMIPLTSNQDPNGTAYCISVDAAIEGVTTGISASDRALTCRLLADEKTTPTMLRRPGHVLPLTARPGGVLERQGHTEAAVDLSRWSGTGKVGVICEMITDGEEVEGVPEYQGGGMMRRDECLAFGRRWGIRVCTIEALREWVEEQVGKGKTPPGAAKAA